MEKSKLPKKRYTAEEAKTVEMVRSNFKASKTARETDSYWGEPIETRWDRQEKMEIGYKEPSSSDDFKSNVKSPMSSGRVESTMHKLRRLNIQFVVRPDNVRNPKEKRKARVIQELLNNLFQRRYFKTRLMTWFKDSLVHGPAFLHVQYIRKKRKVKIVDTDTKSMDDEKKEEVRSGKKVYKEEWVYDYDDIAIEPVRIQEIYVDPSAQNLHGLSYGAQYIIRRMLPSIDQFKSMFENDADAKNVSKVRPASYYSGEETPFFEAPRDVDNDDYVELLHYYDMREDRYIVIANDVVIKDMPLPYNHKQLPFVKIDAYEVLHQIWGMGIPDRLMNIQGEEETLKNMFYDRLHITVNPIMKVRRRIYGEFSKAYQRAEPGIMLPVDNQDDVQTLDYQTTNFDLFRGNEMLDRDAVLASQIDPIQMGVNQKYVSATTSMLTKEQIDAFVAALVDGWTEPLNILAKQCVALMSQFYTVERVEKAGEVAKPRKVRLDDIEINPETLEVSQTRGKYSYLEIKPDYFDINGDWDIEIAPESIEVQSRAIEMQKSQANLAQLAPFFADPNNPQSSMMNPTGWVDGPKAIEWYMETNSIPTDLMINPAEDDDIAIERAELQGKAMLSGEKIPGIPGESGAHKKIHVEQLKVANMQRDRVLEDLQGTDPAMLSAESMQRFDDANTLSQTIADHLMTDDQPAAMTTQAAVMGGKPQQAQQPSVPMPPGLTPAGGAQPPMPAAGNQQSGMEPNLPQQGVPTMAEQAQ